MEPFLVVCGRLSINPPLFSPPATPVPRHTSRRPREGGVGALHARASPFAPLRLVDDETHVNSSRRRRRHHRHRRRHGRCRRVKSVRPKCTAREERGVSRVRPAVPACGTRARASARLFVTSVFSLSPSLRASDSGTTQRDTDAGITDE